MKRVVALILAVLLLSGCTAGAPDATPDAAQPTTGTLPNRFSGLGGQMPELTVNTANGQSLTISQLLQEKKLIVLNFWFEDCPWCLKEFPAMEVAYQKYRDDVQIIALNPADGAEAVKAFQESRGMSISMAACSANLARQCGVAAYPTSLFIDRNGTVCLIHVGAVTTSGAWESLFDAFVGDDYEQKIYNSAEDILG